jgi:predicted DNA binding CopG/RHH family protein
MKRKRTVKHVKKEGRVSIRISYPLLKAVEKKAYEEDKSISAVIVEGVRKYLNFKMPPMPDAEK